MKRKANTVLMGLAAVLSVIAAGCGKVERDIVDPYEAVRVPAYSDPAIEFFVEDTASRTKAITPVTSLSSFYVTATTGSAGSETSAFSNEQFSKSGESFKSGRVWPSSDPAYHFYASNAEVSVSSAGAGISVSSITQDIVCAYLASPTYAQTNSLTFDHILARVGTVNVSGLNSGFTNVSVSLKYYTKGSYNLRTKAWSGKGSATGGTGTYDTKTLSTSDNALWIIPGTYTLTLTFKDVAGNSRTKTVSKDFLAGRVNNITVTLGQSTDVVVSTATEYEAPTFTLGTIADIPASGGSSSAPSVTGIAQRMRTVYTYADGHTSNGDWSAVSGLSSTTTYCKTEGGSYVSTCPAYSASSLTTTEKARTLLGSIYVKVTANGKSTVHSVGAYQAANTRWFSGVRAEPYMPGPAWIVTVTGGKWDTCPAGGGYVRAKGWLVYSYDSGSLKDELQTEEASLTWSTTSWIEPHNGGYHILSRGLTGGAARTATCTWTYNGKTSAALSLTQAGNGVSGYDNPTVTLSYSGTPIAYSSTAALSPSLLVRQKIHYTSGETQEVTLPSGEYTVSYSASSVSGLSLNTSTGVVTPANNTGSSIAARTEYGNPSISTFSYGNIAYTGGSSSPSLSYSQSVTSYSAGRNSTSSRSLSITATVTANGKTGSSSAFKVTQNGDPGVAVTSSTSTETSGASVSYSGSATGLSTNGSTGVVTAGSNAGSGGGVSYGNPSVTFTASTTSIAYSGGSVTCNTPTYSQTKTTAAISSTSQRSVTVTVTVSKHGKSSTKTATCTQNGDPGTSQKTETLTSGGSVSYSVSGSGFSNSDRTITAASNAGASYVEYGDLSVRRFFYDDAGAAGGVFSPTLELSQTQTTGRRTSSSRQGTITATVTMNGKSGSKSITFTQAGDAGSSSTSQVDFSGATKTYTSMPSHLNASLNTNSGVLIWRPNVTSSDNTTTIMVTVNSYGKEATSTTTARQGHDTVTGYSSIKGQLSYAVIPASGGNSAPRLTYSQTVYFASGTSAVITSGASVTYKAFDIPSGFTVSAAGVVRATANTGAQKFVMVRASVNLNGKSTVLSGIAIQLEQGTEYEVIIE